MTTDLFAWPEVEGDINIHGPLSVAIPSSVAGYDYMHRQWGRLPLAEVIAPAIALARRGLPQDWYTALKVATSACGDPALSGDRARVSAERAAAGAALPGQARVLPPGQPARHPGTPRRGGAARLLRGRHRRLGRRGHPSAGRRGVAGGSARLSGAHLAGGGDRLARPDLAAHRRADRGADAEARAGGDGRCALWRRGAVTGLVSQARAGDEGGLCRTARGPRRIRAAGGRKLHDAPDRVRRRGQHRGDDHHADVVVRQPRAAAAIRRAAEQRHDVVRSAARHGRTPSHRASGRCATCCRSC